MTETTVIIEDTKPLTGTLRRPPTRQVEQETSPVQGEVKNDNPFTRNPRKPVYGKDSGQKGALNLPQQVTQFFQQQGFTLSWVRALVNGQPDSPNIVNRIRKGYEFVKPEHFDFGGLENTFATQMNIGDFKGVLAFGDLVLMMIPTELRDKNTMEKHQRALRDQEDSDERAGLGSKIRGIRDINESKSQSENLRFKKRSN